MQFNIKKLFYAEVVIILLLLIIVQTSMAETIDQTITLKPGWNAVFLEVDPVSSSCDDLFSSLNDLISVWTWNPRISTVEYIQDPGTLVPDQPEWLAYFPTKPMVTNLHAIYGERTYLIHMGGTEVVNFVVTGRPSLPGIEWKPDSFNFVGFHLNPGNEPFFQDFFSSSPAHAGEEIFLLNAVGQWEKVTDPATTKMLHGEAFWVYCKGYSEFTGPLSVQLDQGSGLNYGEILSEQKIRIMNHSSADLAVSLILSGGAPPFPLSYWTFDPDNEDVGWKDFPLNLSVPAGVKEIFRMGVRRSGLTPDMLYEANLELLSDAGMRLIVPLSVDGISHSGLWVGSAVIRKVSEPRTDPDARFPLKDTGTRKYGTGSEFSFRLILHVDDSGQVKLLKQAIEMWDNTKKSYVLFSDDSTVLRFSGGDSIDGPGVRRISTVAFSEFSPIEPKNQIAMTGIFDKAVGTLSCTLTVAADDPSNPFRHKYHPDHKKVENAYEVTRNINLIFSSQDSDGNPIASAAMPIRGGSDMGGVYRETLTGLHKTPVKVEGVFLLHKVSSIGQLE